MRTGLAVNIEDEITGLCDSGTVAEAPWPDKCAVWAVRQRRGLPRIAAHHLLRTAFDYLAVTI